MGPRRVANFRSYGPESPFRGARAQSNDNTIALNVCLQPCPPESLVSRRTVPDDRDGGSASSLRVPLHHLKELDFVGGLSSESFTTWTMQGTRISLLAHAKVLSGTSHGPLHRTSETAFTIVTVLKVRWDFPFPGGIVSPHFACMIEAKFSLNQYT